MNIRFARIAESEYSTARRRYQAISPVVADAFVQSIRVSLNLILQFPKIGFEVEPDIRRKLVHRFPFAIFYAIIDDLILVLGIFDLRREPEIWSSRLKKD